MRRWARILSLCAAGLGLLAQQSPQTAQDQPADQDGPGVARLSVMNGDVQVRRGDSGDFIAAAVNAPLVVTDRVVTGPQSRAEIQFDWANMIRVGSNAELRLSDLRYRQYQIQIAIGTTTFRVLRQSDAGVEISTPTVAIHLLAIGTYRVVVREDGSSEITVREGEAEILSPRGSERLRPGETMLTQGSVQDPEFQKVAAIPYDEWDRWNQSRDQELTRSRAYQYVSPDISGAEDLDNNGRWVSVEGYGNVWSPAVDQGWAPYRYGRWVWQDYYGWTWVSYDPWGWAPYHYGRWFYTPVYGWCWWPGGMNYSYRWHPALVAFFGFGGGVGAGFGFGNVGWVPLAPFEVFHPWYGRGFYGGPNAVINANLAATYRNARVLNGITAVNREAFGRAAIGNANLVRVNATQLRGVGLVRGAVPVTPARESIRLADRHVTAPPVSRMAETRTFYSRQSYGARAGQQSAGGWPRVGGATQQPSNGAHRFGDAAPHATPSSYTPRTSTAGSSSGWRRFGGAGGGPVLQPSQAPPRDYAVPSPANTFNGRSSYAGSYATPSQSRAGSSYGSSQPVRINPPMVEERPSNSYGGGGGRTYSAPPRASGGGGGASSPRSSGSSSRGSGGGGSGGGGGHNRGR